MFVLLKTADVQFWLYNKQNSPISFDLYFEFRLAVNSPCKVKHNVRSHV